MKNSSERDNKEWLKVKLILLQQDYISSVKWINEMMMSVNEGQFYHAKCNWERVLQYRHDIGPQLENIQQLLNDIDEQFQQRFNEICGNTNTEKA
jgi:hypothetical protein